MTSAQRQVTAWFEATYRRHGRRYLRPYAAYPIYLQLLGAQPGQRLLDVGCGAGLLLRAARDRGLTACGIDVARTAMAMAAGYARGARLANANAQELCFADRSFDLVTCIGTLERVLDREAALAEVRRVARDGARFCFLVRNSATLAWNLWTRVWWRHAERGHHDAMTLPQWVELFTRAGFAVESVHPDQWLRQRLRSWLRGFREHPFPAPEPIAEPLLPLRFANEFVFVLRHGSGSAPAWSDPRH